MSLRQTENDLLKASPSRFASARFCFFVFYVQCGKIALYKPFCLYYNVIKEYNITAVGCVHGEATMKKILIILITTITVLSLTGICASAGVFGPLDFGDFGGGADYGGGGGGGGDYGGGDGDNWYWFGTSDGEADVGTIIAVVVAIVIFAVIFSSKGKNKPVTNVPTATSASALKPMESYKELDPNFSSADMEAKISNVFIRLQAAWMKRDLTDVRTCLTDEFYAQTDLQLDAYRIKKQTNVIERIAVLGVSLTGWDQNDKNDMIIARVSARMADYVTDDATGEVVRGSRTADRFMEYEWTLVRTKGRKTGVDDEKERKNCPYCGAPLDINRSAKCEYCGNIVSTNDYDWCLASIKGLSQRTVEN